MAISKKNNVYDEIKDAMKERSAMREDLTGKLRKAEAEKAKADRAASEAANSDAFSKAKAASRKAADEIEFYNIQIKNIDMTPLFEDYVNKMAEIKADQQEKIEQINERATKAMHKIADEIEAFYKDLEESNKALELLHTNTGFTYKPTLALSVRAIYKQANAAKANPELSKYW